MTTGPRAETANGAASAHRGAGSAQPEWPSAAHSTVHGAFDGVVAIGGQGVRQEESCALGPQRSSIPAARDFVTQALERWGMTEIRESAELVVSELVTNAVRHGLSPALDDVDSVPAHTDADPGHPIGLRLLRNGSRLVCVVVDPSEDVPLRRHHEMPECHDEVDAIWDVAQAGHGLQLVASYSRRWGWAHLTSGGKAVWAMFQLPPASPSVAG